MNCTGAQAPILERLSLFMLYEEHVVIYMLVVVTDITKLLTFVNMCKLKEYQAFLLKKTYNGWKNKNLLFFLFHYLHITALKKKYCYKEQINK